PRQHETMIANTCSCVNKILRPTRRTRRQLDTPTASRALRPRLRSTQFGVTEQVSGDTRVLVRIVAVAAATIRTETSPTAPHPCRSFCVSEQVDVAHIRSHRTPTG